MEHLNTFEDFIFETEITENFLFESEEINIEELNETEKKNIEYRGEKFPGYNKPKRYKGKGKYKFRVLAKEGDDIAIVNFGHKDYSDFTKHKDPERRKNFRKRHNCDPVKNLSKLTARYWACQYLW